MTTVTDRVDHHGVDLDVTDAMRAFVDSEVRPRVARYEALGSYPDELWSGLAQRRLLIPFLPLEYGGLGANWSTFAASHEILGAPDQSGRSKATAQAMVGYALWRFGTPEQIERYLVSVASGLPAGFCLTGYESGSVADVSGTYAMPTDDGYVLTGDKMWTTNARDGRLFLVFAHSGADNNDQTAFLVPRDADGVWTEPLYTNGIRANGLGSVHFKNVHIGRDAILGPEHEAAQFVRNDCLTQVGRLSVAAGTAGLIDEVLSAATNYTRNRVISGQMLIDQDGTQQDLARIAECLITARLAYQDAARRSDSGDLDWPAHAWLAKDIACSAALEATDLGIALTGARSLLAYASTDESDVLATAGATMNRQWRDLPALLAIEGTRKVTRTVIAEALRRGAFTNRGRAR